MADANIRHHNSSVDRDVCGNVLTVPYRILIKRMLDHSSEPVWDVAAREWHLDHIVGGGRHYCQCNKRITNCCVLYNQQNGNVLHVGTDCVLYFMGEDYQFLFRALSQIRKARLTDGDVKITKRALRVFGDMGYYHSDDYEPYFHSSVVRLQVNQNILFRTSRPFVARAQTDGYLLCCPDGPPDDGEPMWDGCWSDTHAGKAT